MKVWLIYEDVYGDRQAQKFESTEAAVKYAKKWRYKIIDIATSIGW